MRFATLSSGIGAPETAWGPLGWECAFQAEIAPFPCRVLHHRFGASRPMLMPDPDAADAPAERRARAAAIRAVRHLPETGRVPNYGDMTRFKEMPIGPGTVDLVCAGTPCQSFSVAGLRAGMADPRGNLALVFLAILDRLKPTWFLWENVPGVLSSWSDAEAGPDGTRWQSNDFDTLLAGFSELGYGGAYRILDAQYFGVAQTRRRVFVVGHLGDWRRAAAVLQDGPVLPWHHPPRRQAGQIAAGTLGARNKGGGGLGTDFEIDGGLVADTLRSASTSLKAHNKVNGTDRMPLVAPTLTRKWAKGVGGPSGDECQNLVAHCLCASHDASEDGTGRGLPLVSTLAIRGRDGGCKLESRTDGLANTLLRSNGGRCGVGVGVVAISGRSRGAEPKVNRAPRPPHEMQNMTGALDSTKPWNVMIQDGIRAITPLEAERLMGFPDLFTAIPVKRLRKPPTIQQLRRSYFATIDGELWQLAADGPRYSALGNSIAIPPLVWIGERIQSVHELTEPTP